MLFLQTVIIIMIMRYEVVRQKHEQGQAECNVTNWLHLDKPSIDPKNKEIRPARQPVIEGMVEIDNSCWRLWIVLDTISK
jgi:hypothetical protein